MQAHMSHGALHHNTDYMIPYLMDDCVDDTGNLEAPTKATGDPTGIS